MATYDTAMPLLAMHVTALNTSIENAVTPRRFGDSQSSSNAYGDASLVFSCADDMRMRKRLVDAITITGLVAFGTISTSADCTSPNLRRLPLRDGAAHSISHPLGLSDFRTSTFGGFRPQSTSGNEYDAYRAAYRDYVATHMLDNIYKLHASGNTRKALVAVYDSICDLLSDGRLTECDTVLGMVDESKLSQKVLLSFLMATTQVSRDKLPSRQRIYDCTFAKYSQDVGIDRAKKMLGRYK